jgi:TolB-like protein
MKEKMVKKIEKDDQSARAKGSIAELLQQAMRAKGLLLPLSEEDVRHAEIEIESEGVSLPPGLYNSRAIMRRSQTEPLAHEHSIIVVMPFTTVSAEEDSNYFLDIANAISINLADNFPYFIVRTLGTVVGDQTSRAPLDVDFTVHGHVNLVGGRIRANVRLTSERYKATVREQRYDEDFRDIVLLEDMIAEHIAHALNPSLERKNEARIVELRNYFYNIGYNLGNKLTEDGLLRAIRYYSRATRIDSQFAQSDASTADSYMYLGFLGLIPSDEAFAKAHDFANTAFAKDNHLACARTSVAFIEMHYEWQWEKAELSFKDALTVYQEYTLARIGYAQLLGGLGRFDEALTQINEALERDSTPRSEVVRAMILFEARRFGLALLHLQGVLDQYRNCDQIYYPLALVYVEMKMFKEAIAMARKAVTLSAHNPVKIALYIYVLVKAGHITKARNLMKKELSKGRINESGKPHHATHRASPFHWAAIYIALAEKVEEQHEKYYRKAFFHLRKALDKRDQFLFLLRVDPRFDSIRSDSRFVDLLREIRLEPAEVTA